MFAFVDLFLLSIAVGLIRFGWRRGFAAQIFDVIGFGLAVYVAWRFHGPVASFWSLFGSSDGAATALGVITLLAPAVIIAAWFGAKVNRFTWLPGVHLTNRVAGLGLGVTLAALITTSAAIASQLPAVPRPLAAAAQNSNGYRLLTPTKLGQALEGPIIDWGSGVVTFLSTPLDEGEEPDEPPTRFPAATADEIKLAPDQADDMLRRVNAEREKRGLSKLRIDGRLTDVADRYAETMYLAGWFAHTGPDGSTPRSRLLGTGITSATAENLALAPTTPTAHTNLMNSPGHRKNILSPDLTKVGIAIMVGPSGVLAVQEFCGRC